MTDVVVVGAGAAGLMAALFAGREGAGTVLLERTKDGGRKILISGGGRCNVLPGTFRPEEYVTDSSPNSLRRILRSWPLEEQREFFEYDLGIPLKHETDGDKLFPVSDRARDVRDALVRACETAGVRVLFGRTVTGVEALEGRDPEAPRWRVTTEGGERFESRSLVLATGGLSVPATGSDGRGLAWARRLGHEVHPTYAALTPLLAEAPAHRELAGISLEVGIHAGDRARERDARGGFLFTHRGYSGPSVLNVSHVPVRWREEHGGAVAPAAGGAPGSAPGGEGSGPTRAGGDEAPAAVEVAWTEEDKATWDARLQEETGTVTSLLRRVLPQRLADLLVEESGIPPDRKLSQLRKEERRTLVTLLTRYPLPWTGDEGYRKAEVTGGGVALDQVDPGTMESRRCPGLFLCGEMLDAFGPIGGHNFLWAWATGRAAGRGAARELSGTPER